MPPGAGRNVSSRIPFVEAYRSPDFSIPEAAFWSHISSIRWVFGGMAGGVMAAVILADLPTSIIYGWAIGLMAFTFFFELLLRVSALEVELKG